MVSHGPWSRMYAENGRSLDEILRCNCILLAHSMVLEDNNCFQVRGSRLYTNTAFGVLGVHIDNNLHRGDRNTYLVHHTPSVTVVEHGPTYRLKVNARFIRVCAGNVLQLTRVPRRATTFTMVRIPMVECENDCVFNVCCIG
jgi:hypothetical protein